MAVSEKPGYLGYLLIEISPDRGQKTWTLPGQRAENVDCPWITGTSETHSFNEMCK